MIYHYIRGVITMKKLEIDDCCKCEDLSAENIPDVKIVDAISPFINLGDIQEDIPDLKALYILSSN